MAATDIPARDPGPPWTVIAYLPVWFIWTALFELLDQREFRLWPAVGGAFIVLVIWYVMLRGLRWGWVVALALLVLPLLGLPGAFARGLSLGFVSLAGLAVTLFLLLHPDTRAWCSEVRPPMQGPGATERPHTVESAVIEHDRRWKGH